MESRILPLLTWRSAICDSTLAPTTRHVALTLSLWMNERAGSAFPSVSTLVKATGLAERSIRTHLNELVTTGWLELVEKGGIRGEKRRANKYQAVVPTPASVAPMHLVPLTPASLAADPCNTCTPSLQELSMISPGVSPIHGTPDRRVGSLVGGYVEDYRAERDGQDPARSFKASCGKAVKSALRDGVSAEDIARCLGVIAHESKNPSTLPYVLADMHAGRERRMR